LIKNAGYATNFETESKEVGTEGALSIIRARAGVHADKVYEELADLAETSIKAQKRYALKTLQKIFLINARKGKGDKESLGELKNRVEKIRVGVEQIRSMTADHFEEGKEPRIRTEGLVAETHRVLEERSYLSEHFAKKLVGFNTIVEEIYEAYERPDPLPKYEEKKREAVNLGKKIIGELKEAGVSPDAIEIAKRIVQKEINRIRQIPFKKAGITAK